MRADKAHGEDRSFAVYIRSTRSSDISVSILYGGISSGAENWHLGKLDLKPHELIAQWIEYLASLP